MVTFILGEDRYVWYFVHSPKMEYFSVKDAAFRLMHGQDAEAEGVCEVRWNEEKRGIDLNCKLQPTRRSKLYRLELTLRVADEIIKHVEDMEAV